MEKRNLMSAFFAVGIVAFIVLIVIVLTGAIGSTGWSFAAPPVVRQGLAFIIAASAIVLVIIGINSAGREKWEALALASVLLLGISAIMFFSIGLLLAPIGIILFVISIRGLARNPSG